MSRMKHLLRKLHIGGGLNEHHRMADARPEPVPVSNPSPPLAPSSSSSSSSAPLPSPSPTTPDFNFFEEEFQVQLALAISASDPSAGREDPETAQIKAAKRISLIGCLPPVPESETLVEFLSLRYWNYNFINYDEKVVDGFYDVYGITTNSLSQGKMPLLVDLRALSVSDNLDYEVILVNRSVDLELQELENRAYCIFLECQALEHDPILSGLVQKLANLVVGRMGGPVGDADEMLKRWTVQSYELRKSLNNVILPLGCLDVGLSRHRALLFKVLADKINLPCMLVKGSYYTGTDEGAVNLIKIENGSEYIIDLMGAPGALIPVEVPSGHLQNLGSDVRSSSVVTGTVEDPCLVPDRDQMKGIETLAVSPYHDEVAEFCSSNSEYEAIQSIESDEKHAKKNRAERFEHDFGKLLPSLRRSHECSSPFSRKSSSAQKMKVKDVSKYVISAAKNPEFAQKLHAVLLESGASPPPDLFMDINSQDLGEQNMPRKIQMSEGKKVDDEVQCHPDKTMSNNEQCSNPSLPPHTTSDGYVIVGCGSNEMMQAGSTGVDISPGAQSRIVAISSYGEQSHESPKHNAIDSCRRQLESVNDGGHNSLQSAGMIVRDTEIDNDSTSRMGERTNNGVLIDCDHSNRINAMLDEVAEWEISWDDLQIGERIGIGSYGEVYHADLNGTEVAVKKFLDQDFSGEALVQFKCEVEIMLRLRHPNVVLFMGAVARYPNFSILTEFLPRGSLYRLLHRTHIQLDEKRRMRMALDVAKGMNYLHTSHPTIVHRDLKSPNLLVDKNWVVKVCDFGLSRMKHHTFLSSKSTAGTSEWMAPEVLRNEPSNEKCDVYSFGVILWELTTLRVPWIGMNPMQVVGAVGFQNRRLEIPEEVDLPVAQIIRDCWQTEPHLRPSFSQLMSRLRHLQHRSC
ncbi:probable serine/threonine-protein kinase SIS8 [Malania oleifera]|uniref:probable serine/threonine-protein kinase SIS8 n=1 Tax=Malania oleifera TaxID=397392 RepID=UPI0025ADE031|nr:probable serine/threonine-protein kinase SIS8 [Malania oleifera]